MEKTNEIPPSIPQPRSVIMRNDNMHHVNEFPVEASSHKGTTISNGKQESYRSSELSAPSQINSWTLVHVKPVPSFHPVERTAVHLKNIPLEEISARISKFMRLNSICCNYNSDIAKVDCLTPSLLKFAVHLWRSNDTDDNNIKNFSVILEVSRVHGCAIEMQRLRNSMVFAVKTGSQPTIPSHVGLKCPALRELCEQYVHALGNKQTFNECNSDLQITLNLLQSSCVDKVRLGMESLCVMTNPSSVCEKAAELVARAIVYGEGEVGTHVQKALSVYFENNQLSETGDSYDWDNFGGFLGYAQGCNYGVMHNLGLQTLLNALENVCTNTAIIQSEEVDLYSSFWSAMLPALIYNIEVATQRPNEASISAKCINLLSCLEPAILEVLMEESILPAVIQAHEYGMVHHLTLEQSSKDLIRSLTAVH